MPRKEKKMKEETKEEEKSSVYNPYPHMYPGYPPFPGYPPHPYMAYPGFPPAYNPPPMSDDQKMPSGAGNPALPHAMPPYPYAFPPPAAADPKMGPFASYPSGYPYPHFYPHPMTPAMIKKEAAEKK